ncbi:MAG: bifunctional UDP-N-acetylmuramoyl-tripeptide:D-alanyl-D-alanine ligase/alanine racemase [Ferruginibacter sp.]
MSYFISEIKNIISADLLMQGDDALIENLLTDSRKLLFPESSLFFALQGEGRSGASFIKALYDKGVRNFVTDTRRNEKDNAPYAGANFLIVPNVLKALQQLAGYHRHQFKIPVIGITGSNGKTIVKEWLNQILAETFNIVRSPKSYNSQVGVPLSLWRMNESNELGIFESGISRPGEMQHLQEMIDPEIGVVTFIGSAHAEGFTGKEQKIHEKLQLFTNSKQLVFCSDDETIVNAVNAFSQTENTGIKKFSWGRNPGADLLVTQIKKKEGLSEISCSFDERVFTFSIPFTDEASVNNCLACCCILLILKIDTGVITERMLQLRPVEMRLEMKQGINNCSVINDGYSADLNSLGIALDFLEQQKHHKKRTVILSDVPAAAKEVPALYKKIAAALSQKNIYRFIGIGPLLAEHRDLFSGVADTVFYDSTESFIPEIPALDFHNETILLKGARVFRFEKISNALEHKVHETLLEINLNALRHNLKVYRQHIGNDVKVMAMVKAFSYGSGSFEIANLLQHAGVEYLAVAYADEGADLRRSGITLPLMVMNTEPSGFESILKYSLEPEIYSFNILNEFRAFLSHKNITQYPVHIKIDTGMHRLGFEENDMEALCSTLAEDNSFKIISVFSHLAASDAAAHDDFTEQQAGIFNRAADKIKTFLGYDFIRHVANSSAIFRHPGLQMDMVRIGIGFTADASPRCSIACNTSPH